MDDTLPTNIGGLDRTLRFVFGYLMVMTFVLYPVTNHWLWIALPSLGLVPFLTAASGLCPVYLLANFSTASAPEPQPAK